MATDYTIPHDERLCRYLKGERNNLEASASTDLRLSSNKLKDTLKKYDYLFNEVNKRLFDRLKFIKRKL